MLRNNFDLTKKRGKIGIAKEKVKITYTKKMFRKHLLLPHINSRERERERKGERERERERESEGERESCRFFMWVYCFLILNQRSENSPFLVEMDKSVIHEINLFLLLSPHAFVLE